MTADYIRANYTPTCYRIVSETVIIKKNSGGWSGTYNPRTTRPFAIFVNGQLLRDAKGAIRTFGSWEKAENEAKKYL